MADQLAGTLYSADSTNDAIDAIRGPFVPGQPMVAATPCGSNSAPATCPMPPTYPANFLATLNSYTGQVSQVAVVGAAYVPQGGLLFVPPGPAPGQLSPNSTGVVKPPPGKDVAQQT